MLFTTFTAALFVTAEGSVNELPEPEPVFYLEVVEEELWYATPTPEPTPTIVLLRSDPEPERTVPVRPTIGAQRVATPAPEVPGSGVSGEVTHYGAAYNGGTMGCQHTAESRARVIENGGYGDRIYRSGDPSIAASAYDLTTGARPYPCGTVLSVSGPAGRIFVVIQDACPGCGWYHLDLSEEGITRVCGGLGKCQVRISVK